MTMLESFNEPDMYVEFQAVMSLVRFEMLDGHRDGLLRRRVAHSSPVQHFRVEGQLESRVSYFTTRLPHGRLCRAHS